MYSKFFRLQMGKCFRIFAVLSIFTIVTMMLTYVPIQGVRGFAKYIKLSSDARGPVLDYPRVMAVVILVDKRGMVTYQARPDDTVSFRLYLSDLDETDICVLSKNTERALIWLYADAGTAYARDVQQAQMLLRKKPFDEKAFGRLPLTNLQKGMLKFFILNQSFRLIALPKESIRFGSSLFYLRMHVVAVRTASSAP